MTAGDVSVQIVNTVAADIDTAITAQRVVAGASGHYMITAIGPEKQQVVCVAITEA